MDLPANVRINEVVLRDGLQLEDQVIDVDQKEKLFQNLREANIQSFEFGSFVHPKLVPQMANSGELYAQINTHANVVELIGLIPNLKGAEAANKQNIKQLNFVLSASDTHNEQNVHKKTEESLEDLKSISRFCVSQDIQLEVTIATSFGCPFEGDISPDRIGFMVNVLSEVDLRRITLADTTGMANPKQVYDLMTRMKEQFPNQSFSLHFHNTRGMGLANILAGMQAGIRSFDTSLGGLGGCPFAPGATGNVCTEDVVHMLHNMGISTNIDLDKLIATSALLSEMLNHSTPGYVLKAGKSNRKYPVPTK